MKSVKRRAAAISSDRYDLHNPFIEWIVAHTKLGAAMFRGSEVIMGPLASKRFCIGIDDNGVTVLGAAQEAADAISSVNWNTAAFARQVQGRDWVVLASPNFGTRAEPFPLRLWLPTETGKLDGWKDLPEKGGSDTLLIHRAAMIPRKPIVLEETPLLQLALLRKGVWS